MAKVTVKMFATIREAAGVSSVQMTADSIPELLDSLKRRFGPSMRRLIDSLESDPEKIVVLLNGRNLGKRRDPERLRDGDEVAIFPPLSGG